MIHRVHGMANGIKERLHEVKSMKPWEQGRIIPLSGSVNHSELGAKTKLFRVCGVRKHPQTNQGLAKGRRVGGITQKRKKKKAKKGRRPRASIGRLWWKADKERQIRDPDFYFYFFPFCSFFFFLFFCMHAKNISTYIASENENWNCGMSVSTPAFFFLTSHIPSHILNVASQHYRQFKKWRMTFFVQLQPA